MQNELTEIVTVCTRPVQAHVRQNLSMERGGGHEVSHLAKELLLLGRESQFSSRVYSLVG